MFKEQRQSSKLLEPESFDACKNAAAPIITMLGHSELDMEVLDTSMETVKSNDCKGMSRKDGDDFEEVLVDETTGDEFTLLWKATAEPEIEAFPCF